MKKKTCIKHIYLTKSRLWNFWLFLGSFDKCFFCPSIVPFYKNVANHILCDVRIVYILRSHTAI